VFIIKFTNEIFRHYEDFIKKSALYRTPAWSCKFTGKSGLTYEEALEEENKALSSLSKVLSNSSMPIDVAPGPHL